MWLKDCRLQIKTVGSLPVMENLTVRRYNFVRFKELLLHVSTFSILDMAQRFAARVTWVSDLCTQLHGMRDANVVSAQIYPWFSEEAYFQL